MVQPEHTPELILWEDSKLYDSGIGFLPCPTTLRYVTVSAPCPLRSRLLLLFIITPLHDPPIGIRTGYQEVVTTSW
jgi:hypothetical protein